MVVIWCMRWEESPSLHFYWLIFNLPHHIGMVWEELAFNDAVSYSVGKWIAAQLNIIAVTGIHTPVPRVIYSALKSTELSPHPLIVNAGKQPSGSVKQCCTIWLESHWGFLATEITLGGARVLSVLLEREREGGKEWMQGDRQEKNERGKWSDRQAYRHAGIHIY